MLKSAVESLPALLEKKKELEKHTTILKGLRGFNFLAIAVMEQINLREIPNFYDLENTVKSDGKLDMNGLTTFITEKVCYG